MDNSDEQQIRDLLASYTDLWIRHDMVAWGELFTEDCDFITHRGLWWSSREDNVAGHLDVQDSVLTQKANYTQDIVDIQPVAPGVALVHTAWRWPDHQLPSGAAEDRRGLITLVLVEHTGRWLIRAAHNTRVNGLQDFDPAQ